MVFGGSDADAELGQSGTHWRWCLSLGDVLLGVATLVANGVLIAAAHKVPIWRKPWYMRFGKRGSSAFIQIKYEVILNEH